MSINNSINAYQNGQKPYFLIKNVPGIVVFSKHQSDAFVRLQTFLPLVIVIFLNSLESYESIALKLAEDDYAWY